MNDISVYNAEENVAAHVMQIWIFDFFKKKMLS